MKSPSRRFRSSSKAFARLARSSSLRTRVRRGKSTTKSRKVSTSTVESNPSTAAWRTRRVRRREGRMRDEWLRARERSRSSGAGVARLERRRVRLEVGGGAKTETRSSNYYNSSLISLLLEEILPALLLAPRLLARLLTLTLSAESSDELTPREGGFARRRSLLRLLQFHVTRF
jgi:hypothetical protein